MAGMRNLTIVRGNGRIKENISFFHRRAEVPQANADEETCAAVDGFAGLDASSRHKVMEMVQQMLRQEFPELALKPDAKKN